MVILLSLLSLGSLEIAAFSVQSVAHHVSQIRGAKETLMYSSNKNEGDSTSKKEKGILDQLMEPFQDADIPKEFKEEILRAEANTAAAKDRDTRVALYTAICAIGIVLGSGNAFFSTLRSSAIERGFSSAVGATSGSEVGIEALENMGFGWVSGNAFLGFFLLNKIGGALALISAGISGTFIEIEQRSKKENAEKIWSEIQRRRATTTPSSSSSNKSLAISINTR